MKKLFILLTALTFSLSTTLTQAQTTQSATHATKSGKPDMRYKANKKQEDNASSPAAVSAGPKKKGGTLDMRYKANKGAKKTTIQNSQPHH